MQLFTYVYNSITITPTHSQSTYRTIRYMEPALHNPKCSCRSLAMLQHKSDQIWLIGALPNNNSKNQGATNCKSQGVVWGSYSRGKCTSFSIIILVFGLYNLYRSFFFKHGRWPQESDSQRQEWCDISPRCLCHARKLALENARRNGLVSGIKWLIAGLGPGSPYERDCNYI